jgi:transcriptional regulator with XRE-family HTH domain
MAKHKTLMDEIRQELRDDRELNAAYQRELARLEIGNQILKLRQRLRLSQAQLAELIGTKQAGVARMEQASYSNFNVATLAKVAVATRSRLNVTLTPIGRSRRLATAR